MKTIRLFCIVLGIFFYSFNSSAKEPPNVLMIVIDDLNDYPLSPRFNNVKTPNLDVFAETALNFNKAYCPAPICNPSRAAVISGVAPHRSGIYNNVDAWETSELVSKSVPIPMAFKQNGYTTLWSGKFWHGVTTPKKELLDNWWDEYRKHTSFGPRPEKPGLSDDIALFKNANYEAMDISDDEWQDTRTADETIERLGRNYDKPFFMVCGLVRPHNPWTAPLRFFDMYDLEKIELPNWMENDWDDIPDEIGEIKSYPIDFGKLRDAGKWKELLRSYLACISFVDWNLGRVMNTLENSEFANNTIVVIWADHGFHMGEKSHFAKHALWEQTTRNMFMIRTPDMQNPGVTSERVVSLLDIYPTLVDLCGLESVPEQQLDGHSLVPLLLNPDKEWKKPALTTYLRNNHSIRNQRYRYIRYSEGGEELYDLKIDPDEFINLADHPQYQKVKMKLKKHLPDENALPSGRFK